MLRMLKDDVQVVVDFEKERHAGVTGGTKKKSWDEIVDGYRQRNAARAAQRQAQKEANERSRKEREEREILRRGSGKAYRNLMIQKGNEERFARRAERERLAREHEIALQHVKNEGMINQGVGAARINQERYAEQNLRNFEKAQLDNQTRLEVAGIRAGSAETVQGMKNQGAQTIAGISADSAATVQGLKNQGAATVAGIKADSAATVQGLKNQGGEVLQGMKDRQAEADRRLREKMANDENLTKLQSAGMNVDKFRKLDPQMQQFIRDLFVTQGEHGGTPPQVTPQSTNQPPTVTPSPANPPPEQEKKKDRLAKYRIG